MKSYIDRWFANQASELAAEINECRARIEKTEKQIGEMVGFIKNGERSEFVASSLRELEPYLRAEKARLQKLLEQSAAPVKRPSTEKIAKLALDLEARLHQDIEAGRAQLQRWLRSGKLQVSQDEHGIHHAKVI